MRDILAHELKRTTIFTSNEDRLVVKMRENISYPRHKLEQIS